MKAMRELCWRCDGTYVGEYYGSPLLTAQRLICKQVLLLMNWNTRDLFIRADLIHKRQCAVEKSNKHYDATENLMIVVLVQIT